jgi:hypothetical protein
VKGAVNGCDIVAVWDGEPPRLAVVEMKLGFNLDAAAGRRLYAGGG